MKILTILLLFFYIFPIFPKVLPIPLDRLIEILGLFYFVLTIRKNAYLISNKYIFKTIGLAILLFVVSFIPLLGNYDGLETEVIKISFDLILFLFGSFLICDLIKRNFNNFSIIKVFEILILVFSMQGVISLLFYFQPSIYNSYTNLLNTDVSQNLYERLHLAELRLMGVGNAFFNGVIKYGICLIILTFLKYIPSSIFHKKPLLFLSVFVFIVLVGIMTGRTFFIAVLISICILCYFEFKRIDKLIIKALFIPIVIALIIAPFYFLFSNYVDTNRLDNTLNFVLEFYYNYEATGQFSTNSSSGTLSMYVWPEELSTWIIGDGRFINPDGSYYMHTDVGYLRLIYYFGLVGTFVVFFIQFQIILFISKNVKNTKISYCLFFIFIWILILNLKGIAYFFAFEILFLVASLIENKSERIKNRKYQTMAILNK
ncbi:O-antigen polymerase [Sphingobacterium cellulitidis]|uniref:Uncharacterized protein n=1 Tax=Sphingobacterium cellulitidis TaxID=1768011 RepID=A0A8H9G0K0_9SPHI|nr:O-antigen polymerase [Sphingobacterium soli]MBA8987577.1 hypothetical protein [Sphingobacterium soli]GGE23842.1 hypothetical protein GCM10011516_21900 [Sphingobacterium soli]